MWRDSPSLALGHAVALGLAQGPTELLPISSSAHTVLIPFLKGWRLDELDPELRKSLQVALHAGTAVALLVEGRRGPIGALRGLDRRGAAFLIASCAPAALVGYALERPIQQRLDNPRTVARALIAGAVAMALADGLPRDGTRPLGDAGVGDGLALGLAQAVALIPGISRNGATLAAARVRGFGRAEAEALSWRSALPVILAAGALKGARLARAGTPPGSGSALAVAGVAAFVSTLASARLLGRLRRREGALLPYAIYRCVLAALTLRALRGRPTARARRGSPAPAKLAR